MVGTVWLGVVGLGTATQAPGWASGWISLRFTDFFSQLKLLEAEVPPNVELYLRMSAYNLAENKALNMEGLSLEERAIFCESPLYKDFLTQVAKARFQEALEKPPRGPRSSRSWPRASTWRRPPSRRCRSPGLCSGRRGLRRRWPLP